MKQHSNGWGIELPNGTLVGTFVFDTEAEGRRIQDSEGWHVQGYDTACFSTRANAKQALKVVQQGGGLPKRCKVVRLFVTVETEIKIPDGKNGSKEPKGTEPQGETEGLYGGVPAERKEKVLPSTPYVRYIGPTPESSETGRLNSEVPSEIRIPHVQSLHASEGEVKLDPFELHPQD